MKPMRAASCRTLLAAVALAAPACAGSTPYEKPLTPVRLEKVGSYRSGVSVRYSGTVKPALEVGIAFKVGGYVDEVLTVKDDRGRVRDVQEGDYVAKGARLARVRASDYQQHVAQARAGQAEASAMQESARLDFERASRLFEKGSLTKPELDAAKARFDAATARVAGARAAVGQTEILLDDVVLRSPIDGVVITRAIERGSLAAPGQPAFTLASTRSVKVSFGVPDIAVKSLTIGRPQRVAFEALKAQEFEGRITSIAPSPDPVSRVYEIEVTIPNPRRQIEIGFTASLQLADEIGQTVATVPLEAIVKPPGGADGYAAFVVDEQGGRSIAHLRRVQLGEVVGNSIVITGGLSAGQQVVVRGATLIADGEAVRPVQ